MPLFSQRISGELWLNEGLNNPPQFDTDIRDIGTTTEEDRKIINELLMDTIWIISGMIYGFNVSWNPGNPLRSIDESFVIEPSGSIAWGDRKLSITAAVRDTGNLYVWLDYQPDAIQKNRIASWQGKNLSVASGSGEGSILKDNARRLAMETAIKEAMRRWLRAREYNRPRLVVGRAALTEFPSIGFREGNFTAKVSIALKIEVIPLGY